MERTLRTVLVSLLLATGCNGTWHSPGRDARESAAAVVFDDAAAAAHADAPHVQPRDAPPDHQSPDASADTPDAEPDVTEVMAESSEDQGAPEGGTDVSP
jgi:hypothetical protein